MASTIVFLGILYPHSVRSDQDCVTCGIQPDPTDSFRTENILGGHLPGLTGINCYESDNGYTFEEGFCMAYFNVEAREDFEAWIDKCKDTDPRGRSSIIEYMDTISCDSQLIKSFAVKYPNAGITESLIPLNQFMVYQDTDVAKVVDFFRHLMKSYRDEGKGRGYPELKQFVAVLNKPDPNGMTFLDNVLLRWDDEFCEEVMFKNQRDRMIRNLCKVGARFSPSTNVDGITCVHGDEYIGS